ncbi:MAG: hypothetical protein GX365_01115 [Clostridiales bacterium]|nr:hypothetical protein [Clostridiales bacterium]
MENYDNPIIEKEYNIPLDIFNKAFTAFQKKFIYPKTYIMTFCYVFIIIWQVTLIARDIASSISGFIIAISIFAIFISWYNPRKIKNNLLISIKEIETDLYKFKLYEDSIALLALSKEEIYSISNPQEEAETSEKLEVLDNPENEGNYDIFEGDTTNDSMKKATFLIFDNAYFSIIEKEEFYMLYQSKVVFYVVPKKDFTEPEILQMNELFKEKLGKRFS